MSSKTRNPLTSIIKRLLDVVRVLAIISLAAWPLFVIGATVGQQSDPETWGVDISVFARFIIDLNVFTADIGQSTGVRDPIISGNAALNLDTSSLYALYVFTAITEIGGVLGLYVVIQLRSLFGELASGAPFSEKNSGHIKKTAIAVLAWTLIMPILQYFGGHAILAEYALQTPGVNLYPAFAINGAGIFSGLALFVLARVLNEATAINEAQELTI